MKPAKTRRISTRLLSVIMAASLACSDGMVVLAQPSVSDSDVIVTVAADTSDGQDTGEGSVSDSDVENSSKNNDVTAGDVTNGDVTDGNAAKTDVTAGDVSLGDLLTVEGEPLFSGMDDYVLSAEQLEDKQELARHVPEIPAYSKETADGAYVPGQVVYMTDSAEEAKAVAEGFNGALESYYSGVAIIELPEDRTVIQAVIASASEYYNLPAVWPNYYKYLDASYSDPYLKENSSGYQWFHESVGSEYVWQYGYTGKNVKIGIIDSGVLNNHEDLTGHVKKHVSMTGSVISNATSDPNGHGTHVAGIAAAAYNNAKGGAGIAPEAGLYVYGVTTSEGRTTDGAIVRALNQAVADGVDVINISIGGPSYDANEQKAVTNAYKAGITVFASAGNEYSNTFSYPACYKNVCSVGALQPDGTKAGFSNYNSSVDFAFPGVDIYSTYNSGAASYTSKSGTSMSCPVATGTAAVILSGADDIKDLKGKTGSKRVDALVSIMKKNAVKSPSSGTGAGTTYLPKVFGITPDRADATPAAPKFSAANKTTFSATTANVSITCATTANVSIYYSTDGKTPSYKNGTVTNGTLYRSAVELDGTQKKSVTLKAIAVNYATGTASKVSSATYYFDPVGSYSLVSSPVAGISTVPKGGSLTLKVVVTPTYVKAGNVTWSVASSKNNASVQNKSVTVKNGKISATKNAEAGSYTVQANIKNSKGADVAIINQTFSVTEPSTVQSVAFSKETRTLSLDTVKTKTASLAGGLTVTYKDGTAKTDPSLVKWVSSNTAVATVNYAGVVTAKGPGKADIKITTIDGSYKSAVCKVTVTQPVTSINISGSSLLAPGKSISLNATPLPGNATNKKLEWSVVSGDVSVKNGKVTAKKTAAAGSKCVVAAKAADGSGVYRQFQVTITDEPVKSISLNQKTMSLFCTAGYSNAPTTGTIVATTPNGDTSSLVYTSSAPGIATVNSAGKVTARAVGKAVITCAATDGSGKKATCTVTVSAPMSKLTIVTPTDNTGTLSVGTSLKLSTKIGTNFGKVLNNNIVWEVANADKEKISVSSKGVVKALAMVSPNTSIDSKGNTTTATVYAKAADGSGVSDSYVIYITRKIKSYGVDRSGNTFRPYIVYDNKDEIYTPDYSVSISSPGNLICSVYEGTSFSVYSSKPTTTHPWSYFTLWGRYYPTDCVKANIKVKFQTGSGKTWSHSYDVICTTDNKIYMQ